MFPQCSYDSHFETIKLDFESSLGKVPIIFLSSCAYWKSLCLLEKIIWNTLNELGEHTGINQTLKIQRRCVFFCLHFKGIHQFSNLAKERVLEQHWVLIVPHFSAQAPLHSHWEPGRALGRQPDVFSQSWHCTLLPFGQSEIKQNERRGTWSTWLFPRIHSKSPSQWSSAILGCIKATLELRVI